jgi:hypothetical protein
MTYLRAIGEEPMWYGVLRGRAGLGIRDFTTEGTEDTEKKGKRAALRRRAKKKSAGIKASATFQILRQEEHRPFGLAQGRQECLCHEVTWRTWLWPG